MKKFVKSLIRYWLIAGAIAQIICVTAAFIYIDKIVKPATDIDLSQFTVSQTSVIANYDDSGDLVIQAKISSGGDSKWIPLSKMPKSLQQAAMAIEDERFETHKGVDWKRTVKGLLNLTTGDSGGGSTITQQLVKNLTGNDEYSIKRKLTEIFSALALERNNSKDEILECYLNTIYLANGCNGVETASQRYFGKPAEELSLAESASLIAITQYPSYYNPIKNPENNSERRTLVLWKMWQLGMISESEYRTAAAEPVKFIAEPNGATTDEVYSYFTDFVFDEVVGDLVEQKGYTLSAAKAYVANGGLTIISTMDSEIQAAVDEVFTNEGNFPNDTSGQTLQAGISIVDVYTGKLIAIYGGRGEKTESLSLNRASGVYRQPGSVIKPLSVYAPALEYGIITEASVYDDTPFDIENKWPKNYDSEYNGYSGLMSATMAVSTSANTVAVKILSDLGLEKSYRFLTEKFKLSQVVDSYSSGSDRLTDIAYSPLALGGLTKGTNTLELASAYAAFAASGVYSKPYSYHKVIDANGNIILENTPVQEQVMSAENAYIMTDMLTKVIKEGTGRVASLGSISAAGKTGTTSENKDRWFVGYTPYYSCAVWVGYDTPQEISVSGTNPALKIWKAVMSKAHQNISSAAFEAPENIVYCEYCTDCGKLPTAVCKNDPRGNRIKVGKFVKGTEPTEKCDIHTLVAICNESGCIAGENCPTGNISYKALIKHKRVFPYEISVKDAGYTYLPLPYGYTMPENGLVYQSLIESGSYCGITQGNSAMNSVCTLHKRQTNWWEDFFFD